MIIYDSVGFMKDTTQNTKTAQTELNDDNKELTTIALERMAANFSNYVKSLKKRAGDITSRELSRRTGVSVAVISDIEGNKYLPKMEIMLKIAYGMNVEIAKLLDNLWDIDDAAKWANITNNLSEVSVAKSKQSRNNNLSLDNMLAKEGLTKNDIKEVLEFIEFKKSKQKRR